MLKMSLGLVSSAALISLFVACSSSTTETPAATPDAGPGVDSGKTKTDSGPVVEDEGGTTTCAPDSAAVKDFTPTWHAPTGKGLKKCTDAQVEAILSCLLDDTADQTACKAVIADKNNKDCATCVSPSAATAKTYGPLTQGDGTVGLNVAGCVALLEPDLTDKGCGAKIQALGECADTACACPVTDDASFAAFQKCQSKAETTVCKAFAGDAACQDDLTKAGAPAEECDISGGGTFIDNAMKYGKLFCAGGTAPVDGGKDAPSDG